MMMVKIEFAPIDRPTRPMIDAVYCGLRLKR
jgi:hypothetical protein